jgi:hypothetical protein
MKKLITLCTIFIASLFLSSCGGSSCSAPVALPAGNVASGSVADGPIYNAIVEFYDMNGTPLTTEPSVVRTDDSGKYQALIHNMPSQYRVVVREGSDSSVDGDINANDENNSIILSSIVTRDEGNETVGHVTPATTLVDSIVEDGALPLDEATDLVKEQLGGADIGEDLSKLDPNKHDVANKLGNLVALLTKMVPSEDKKITFKAVAKIVIKKKIKITISNMGLDIQELNLTAIANEARELGAEIALDDMEKIASVESVILDQLSTLMEKIKAVDTMSDEDKKEALVAYNALFELLAKVKDTNLDELDEETLKLFVYNLQESVKAILDEMGREDIGSDDIDFVSNLVKEHLDKDVNEYKKSVVKALQEYKIVIKLVVGDTKVKISLKKVIKLIYKNSDLDALTAIKQALGDNTHLEELLKAVEAMLAQSDTPQLQALLEDLLATKMAQTIEDQNGSVSGDEIAKGANEVVNNPELIATLKVKVSLKITIKAKAKKEQLTFQERMELVAINKVVKDIKVNIKIKVFTKVAQDNAEALYEELLKQLMGLASSDVQALNNQIKGFELFVTDLFKSFNAVEFKEKLTITIKIVKQVTDDKTVDAIKTIFKLKVVVEAKFVVNTDDGVVTIEEDEVKENIVPAKPLPKVITLPQPKLSTMPSDMLTNIKVTL